MTGYPLVVDGAALRAVVVGGGTVAERKVRALLDAGAAVSVIAIAPSAALRALAEGGRLRLAVRGYEPGDVGDALLVVAATDDRQTNSRVAAEGRAGNRLVNVADAPEEGNCVTVAVHRAGELVVAVHAGGVPGAAARIRDAIAERFGESFGEAVHALVALRARLLSAGDRTGWERARESLIGADFCPSVESGSFRDRVSEWR